MKNLYHRALSLLLSAVLLAGLISTPALAAAEAPPQGAVLLDGVNITLREGVETEGMTFSAFAAVGVDANGLAASEYELAERGSYGVTIYRTGDLSLPTSLRVSTLDISASYGTDYRLLDRGDDIVVTGADATVMELAMTPEARQAAEEEAARLREEALAGLREEGASAQPETEAEPAPEDGEEAVNASSLARMMEEQTGMPARTPAGQEIADFSDSLISYLGGMPTDYFEPSAMIDLSFAPGETEKQIWFEILEDEQSEGTEAFSLILDGRTDTSFVVTPYMCTVTIADDEPVEHSIVSFAKAEYTADGQSVKVTVERSGAEYTFATVGIRSVQDGTARRGLNYANVNTELQFLPNQTTAELTIAVSPDAEITRDFSLELYDPMGCDAGAVTYAHVKIPLRSTQGADEPAAELMGTAIQDSKGYAAGSSIELSGVTYKLQTSGTDGVFKLMQGSHYAGDLYMPSLFSYRYGGDDTPNSSADASYHAGAVEGRNGPVGHLKWYSHLIWQTGWAIASYKIMQPERYQLVYVDYETDSGLIDVSMGWGIWFYDAKTSNKVDEVLKSSKDNLNNKTIKRTISSPFDLFYEKSGKYIYYGHYHAYDQLQLRFEAERKGTSAARPETWFWGVPCLFTQFRVTLEQPDQMEFKTVDAEGKITTTKRAPAKVEPSGWNPNDPLYLGEKVVTYTSPSDSDVICGTLTGYNIYGVKADGTKTEAIFVEKRKDEESFTIDLALQSKLDKAGAAFEKNGDRFEMPITVKPVFRYKDVTVEAVPHTNDKGQVIGRFTNELTGTYHVGDELPMDAQAAEGFSNWVYATYRADGYKNPGDRTPAEFAGPNSFAEQKVLKLRSRQYKLAPIFNDEGNYIAVFLDDRAKELFQFEPADILTEAEITATGKRAPLERFREGWAILRTESADKMTPTVGKAYTVSLVPKDRASAEGQTIDGKLQIQRPKFTSDWENVEVKGYTYDMIADGDPLRNLVRVSADTVPKDSFRYMALEGVAQYCSVTMRDSAEDLRNVPAMDVSVTAGANWIERSPNRSKLARTVTTTDREGKFSLDGVFACPGDTISVLMQHSGVWQVRYVTLGEPGSQRECTVNTPRYNPGTGAIDYTPQKLTCGVVNLSSMKRAGVHTATVDSLTGAFNLPFRTPYTPYIRDFTFTHTQYSGDNTAGSRVAVVSDDSVRYRFEVEANGQKVKAVRMRFYNENNVEQFSEDAKPEAEASRYFVAIIPSSRVMPGYKLYLQIVSDEQEEVVSPDGRKIKQDKFFPTLNSGLAYYVPQGEGLLQNISMDLTKNAGLPQYIGDLPALGGFASSADSGKLIWTEEYENPSNPEKGKYSRIVGLKVEFDEKTIDKVKENWDKTSRHTGGSAEKKEAEEAKGNYDQQGRKAYDDAKQKEADRLAQEHPGDPVKQAEELKKWEQNAKSADARSQELYEKAVVSVAGDKTKIGFALFLRFEYYYNQKDKKWDYTGYQLMIQFSGSTGKTTPFSIPTPVGPIPAYLYVGGSMFFNLEIAYTYQKSESLAAEYYLKRSGNIAPVFSNASPWLTLGGSLEFWLGVGFNNFLSIRGIIALDLELKWNPNTSWSPNVGYNVGVKGGFGFDLVLVKFNWKADIARMKKGAFYEVKPTYSQVKNATLMSNEVTAETAASAAALLGAGQGGFAIEALDMGQERYSVFDKNAMLMSIPTPYTEKNLVEGTLEYTRPKVVQVDDAHYLLFFLRNDAGKESGRDTANASSINYAMGTYNAATADIAWSNATPLETDGSFDTSPVVLKASDGKVYVAWSNTRASGSTDAYQVERDLSHMDIHMTWLTKQGESYQPVGSIYRVTNDAADPKTAYLNTSAILTEENGNIAVTYMKLDASQLDLEEMVSGTGSGVMSAYSLWARKIFDPKTGKFIPQTSATGTQTEELVIRGGEGDAYTPEYASAVYTFGGNDYRISAYILDTVEGSVEESMQLWVKVDNLTNGRAYAPMLVDVGDESLMGSRLTAANHKAISEQQETEEVVDDLLLTWLTDGTVMNTLSAYEVFSALEKEGSMELIAGLSEDQIARRGWAAEALKSAGEDHYALDGLAHEPISYDLASEVDFGETLVTATVSGDEEVENRSRTGLSLEGYQVVSGKDGNAYLFWIWPAGLSNFEEDDIGSEIWGSSYTRICYDDADYDMQDARDMATTWSNPVQITDCTVLNDANMSDGRMIDELHTLVGTDSGAIMVANTYDISFNDSELVFGPHNLTQILCEAEGSLEVSDPNLMKVVNVAESSGETEYSEDRSTLYPVPGEHYALELTLKNAGLLSTENYRLTMEEIVDGVSRGTKTLRLNADGQKPPVLTAGSSRTVYPQVEGGTNGEYVIPEYQNNLRLVFTVREYHDETPYDHSGQCDWSANRLSVFDFHTVPGSDDYAGPTLMTMDELAEIIDVFGSTREEIDQRAKEYAEMFGPDFESGELLDGRLLALLNTTDNLETWMKSMVERTPEGRIPYIAFVPVWNFGSLDAGALSAKIVYEKYTEGYAEPEIETLGTGTLPGLRTGVIDYIVAPVTLNPEHFNDLGIAKLPVQVTYQGERRDDDRLLLQYHTPDNLGLYLSAPGAGDAMTTDGAGRQVLQLRAGETVALKSSAWPFGSDSVLYYAAGETETAEPCFAVDLDGRVTGIREGTGYVWAEDAESGVETRLLVRVGGAAPDPVPYDPGTAASGGGTTTVKVSSDTDTEPLTVKMTGTQAAVEEMTDQALARLTAPAADAQQKKEVVFDLRGLDQTVETVVIPAKTVNALADAIESCPAGGSLIVKAPDFTVLLDRAAVAAAEGSGDLTVSVKRQSVDALKPGQKAALEGRDAAAACEVTISRGGKAVTDLGGGRLRVSVPMTPGAGRSGHDYRIYYLPESGTAEKQPASFVNGRQVFWVSHCSTFAAVYEHAKNGFTDVADGQFYTDPVLWAVSGGITTGTGADTFSPDASCTRAQMVTFLWRATGSPKPESVANPFKDVPEDAWYRDAVLWAVQAGVTNGTGADTFSPDQTVTRAQCVTFLWRDATERADTSASAAFKDVPTDAWYSRAVAWAAGEKITLGTGDAVFSPDNPCKRSEIVTFLYRYFHSAL